MIKALIFTIVFFIWFSFTSYGLLIPSIGIKKEKELAIYFKKVFQTAVQLKMKYGFEADINYFNQISYEPDKVNILICNHNSTIDWEFIITMLKEFNIDTYILVGKKGLVTFPGFGINFLYSDDIKLDRKWGTDENNIQNQINNINKGIICIFPEGTRIDMNKKLDAQNYSTKVNIPTYNNLLVPKSKGLWAICNNLKKRNKLGYINDMTLILENYIGNGAYFNDLLTKPLGKVFIYNRQLHITNYIEDNNEFKNWLLNVWTEKDIIINNYKNFDYKKLDLKIDNSHLIIFLSTLFVGSYMLTNKYCRNYFITMILIGYSLVYLKYKKL